MRLADAERLALDLMKEHGIRGSDVEGGGWSLEWTRAKRAFGIARFQTRTIGLSAPLVKLNDEAEVRDTILHEIAHVAQAGHGWRWKVECLKVGANPARAVEDAVEVPARYEGRCPQCGEVISTRHRWTKARQERVGYCRRCRIANGAYDERSRLVWYDTTTDRSLNTPTLEDDLWDVLGVQA